MYIVVIYLCVITMVTFTGSEKVTWSTAHTRCRNKSQYLKHVNPYVNDYWLPEFIVTVYFRGIGYYTDQLLHRTVSSPQQCFLACEGVTHSYVAFSYKEATLNCGCLSEQDIQQRNRVTCGSDSAVRVYEEINYEDYNKQQETFYSLDIECDDRGRECMDMWLSDKVTIKCKYKTGFPRTTKTESCTDKKIYKCEDVKMEDWLIQTTAANSTTTLKTTSLEMTPQTKSETSTKFETTTLGATAYQTTHPTIGKTSAVYAKANLQRTALETTPSEIESVNKDIVQENVSIGTNITNIQNTSIDTIAVVKKGMDILLIPLGVVLAVVIGIVLLILLIWRLNKSKVQICCFMKKNIVDTDSNRQNKNFEDHKKNLNLNAIAPTNDYPAHLLMRSEKRQLPNQQINVSFKQRNVVYDRCFEEVSKYEENKGVDLSKNSHFENNYSSNSSLKKTDQDNAILSEPYNTLSFENTHEKKSLHFKNMCLPQDLDHLDTQGCSNNVQYDQISSEYDVMKLDHGDYDHLNIANATLTDNDFTYSSVHLLDAADSDYNALNLEDREQEGTYFDSMQQGDKSITNDIVVGTANNSTSFKK